MLSMSFGEAASAAARMPAIALRPVATAPSSSQTSQTITPTSTTDSGPPPMPPMDTSSSDDGSDGSDASDTTDDGSDSSSPVTTATQPVVTVQAPVATTMTPGQIQALQTAINAAAAALGVASGPTDGIWDPLNVSVAVVVANAALIKHVTDVATAQKIASLGDPTRMPDPSVAAFAFANASKMLLDGGGQPATAWFTALAAEFAVPWWKHWYVWVGAGAVVLGGGYLVLRRRKAAV